MPEFTISDASIRDADRLLEIEAACFAADRLSRTSLRRLLDRHSATVRVAQTGRGGRIEGYTLILFRVRATAARLYSIAVDPEARGKGLARTLMHDAEAVARRRGCDRLRLEVRADNQPAIRLYQRLGYRPFGRHERYYADGTDAIRFERRLADRAETGEEDRSPRDSGICFPYIDSIVRPVLTAEAVAPAGAPQADGVPSVSSMTVAVPIPQRHPSRTP